MEQLIVYILKVLVCSCLVLVTIKTLSILRQQYTTKPSIQALEQQVDNLIKQQEYFDATMKVINEAHCLSATEFARLLDKVNQAAVAPRATNTQEESPVSHLRDVLSKSNTIELSVDEHKVLILQIDPIKPAYRTYNIATDEIRMHTYYNNRVAMYDDIVDILCTQYRENDGVSIIAISSMLEYTDLTEVIAKIQKKKEKDSLRGQVYSGERRQVNGSLIIK